MTMFQTELDKIKEEERSKGFRSGVATTLMVVMNYLESNECLEELSELEHKQWLTWTKNLAKNNDIPKWLKQHWFENWIEYRFLTEKIKELDRVWAKKVIDLLHKKIGEIDTTTTK